MRIRQRISKNLGVCKAGWPISEDSSQISQAVVKHMLEAKEVHNTSMDFEPRDWQFAFIDYALHNILPDNPKEAASIRWRSLRFYYYPIVKTPYRRSYDSILLHCLSNSEAWELLKEAHDGVCGVHQPGPRIKDRLRRLGYYWPTKIANPSNMHRDVKLAKSTQTLYINLWSYFIRLLPHAHSKHRESTL